MQVKKWTNFSMFHHWKSWIFFCLFFWYSVFMCIYFKISSFLCQRKEKWQILFWKCFDMKYFNFYVQSLRGAKSVFQSCNAIFVNKFHYFAVECLKWRPRGIKSLHSGFRGTMYFTKLKSQHNPSHNTKSIYYCSLLFHQNNWGLFHLHSR